MAERILVDTGPIVAILSRQDQFHNLCVAALGAIEGQLVTCWPVLTEAAWLLRGRPHAVQRLLNSIDGGALALLPLGPDAPSWIASFMSRYEDLPAQLADAALAYLADTERIDTVFTLDRRDFSVYRIRGNQPLRLIPQP